jgi:hypothetical protein
MRHKPSIGRAPGFAGVGLSAPIFSPAAGGRLRGFRFRSLTCPLPATGFACCFRRRLRRLAGWPPPVLRSVTKKTAPPPTAQGGG